VANIHDVAKRAGVSIATVSRVLNKPGLVPPETTRKVMAAVERLGYEPNSAGKNLRMLRTRKLLVTVPDITRPLFSLILQGIEEAADDEGYSVLLGDTQYDQGREERYASMLKRKEADGLIFLGRRLSQGVEAYVRSATSGRAPVVNALGFSPQLGIPSVQIDNAAAGAAAMDHLYGLGHRRIGIVTGPVLSFVSHERHRGVNARAKKERAQRDLVVVNGDFSIHSGVAAGERLLRRGEPPTAVFCFNDEMAMGILHAARVRKIRVPEELSVIGVDDIRYVPFADPPLTTVQQPMREMGKNAVRVLLGVMRSEKWPEAVTLPHTLIVRSSTAAPRRK
jgi:LacI family repressor for deo operon, udp, cdd, tsx, nupC, and nupG